MLLAVPHHAAVDALRCLCLCGCAAAASCMAAGWLVGAPASAAALADVIIYRPHYYDQNIGII
jgi:hypothetical protein